MTRRNVFPKLSKMLSLAALAGFVAVVLAPLASADPIVYQPWSVPGASTGPITVPGTSTPQCTDPACTTGTDVQEIDTPTVGKTCDPVLGTCVGPVGPTEVLPGRHVDPLCLQIPLLCATPTPITGSETITVSVLATSGYVSVGTEPFGPVTILQNPPVSTCNTGCQEVVIDHPGGVLVEVSGDGQVPLPDEINGQPLGFGCNAPCVDTIP